MLKTCEETREKLSGNTLKTEKWKKKFFSGILEKLNEKNKKNNISKEVSHTFLHEKLYINCI